MTTIAFDGKTLAADSRSTMGGLPYLIQKLKRLKDGALFAASGEGEACELAFDWLNDPSKPKPKIDPDSSLCAMVVRSIDGKAVAFLYRDELCAERVNSPFIAIGSGRDFAIAAMHLGLCARDAVEISKLYDVYTGGPVVEATP